MTAILSTSPVVAKQWSWADDRTLDVSGYLGYRQIFSTDGISLQKTIPSEPEIGLMTSYKHNKYLTAFVQTKYGTSFDDVLVYAFLATTITPVDSLDITFRGGKVWSDVGLYNIYRINPRTRPQVIMPQAIYFDSLVQTLTSGAGVQLEVKYNDFSVSYSAMDPATGATSDAGYKFTGPLAREIDTNIGSLQSVTAKYQPIDIPVRATASYSRIDLGNKTVQADQLPDILFFKEYANKPMVDEWVNMGVEYKPHEDLTLYAEGLLFKFLTQKWHDASQLGTGWSVGARYDVNPYVSVYANYNDYYAKFRRDAQIKTGTTAELPNTYLRDFTFGTNLHYGPWMFGVEGHQIKGTEFIDELDYPPKTDAGNWWMIGMNLVYFFD